MKIFSQAAGLVALLAMAGFACPRAGAQSPATVVPIVADTAVPIIVNAVKPKPTGWSKFEGFVMNANTAQITVRAKGNDMAIQTFALSAETSAKMQVIIDKGGFQYGDRVMLLVDPASNKVMKVKGKPSKAL